jgi:hypothetical protein
VSLSIVVHLTNDSSSTAAWAAAIGALGGAALGGFITYLATRRQVGAATDEGKRHRDADAEQRQLDRDHEIALAREAREQQRLLDTAVAVMSWISLTVGWAHWRFRCLQVGGPPFPEPELAPTDPADQALAVLILSKDASQSLLNFRRAFVQFMEAANRSQATGLDLNSLAQFHDEIERRADILKDLLRSDLRVEELIGSSKTQESSDQANNGGATTSH